MRSIVIGDVHGCLAELDDLLAQLALRGGDRLFFLGDLVDRGPDTLGVVRRVRALLTDFPGSAAIAGNHEEKALRDRDHGRPGAPWAPAAAAEDWAFLDALPLVHRLREHGALLVHGGIYPRFFADGSAIGEADGAWRKGGGKRGERLRRFLRVRSVDAAGSFVGLQDAKPEHRHWCDVYDGREGFCFFGHDPQLSPCVPRRGPHALGLDTGCCFGGRLTAAILEAGAPVGEARFVSVQARGVYAEPRQAHREDA